MHGNNHPDRRNRDPRGFIPVAPSAAVTSVPAMLEIFSSNPMYTQHRGPVNLFVPDAQMLFHVLGICDRMMNSTDRFTRSFPGWLPIVSHLYIAVLWNFMILKVVLNSGHGAMVDLPHFQIGECMIPGPLVPFFQSLAAVNGPFDWVGDIVPHLPDSPFSGTPWGSILIVTMPAKSLSQPLSSTSSITSPPGSSPRIKLYSTTSNGMGTFSQKIFILIIP
ncbi:unnamed protein product [Cuscuta europaea]|uniref:Uncharacterized protein n=1 Tax=Cuscuta europaea TaxID=41803 RepID=A0A9P0ZKX3_CUSEU|nr:unnamed protein product [Cuscuta europaea]